MLSHRAKQPIISWASAPIGADANMTARLEDVELSLTSAVSRLR
jgi:hypothetical protein